MPYSYKACNEQICTEYVVQDVREKHHNDADSNSDYADNQARTREYEPQTEQDEVDSHQIVKDIWKYNDNDSENDGDYAGEQTSARNPYSTGSYH